MGTPQTQLSTHSCTAPEAAFWMNNEMRSCRDVIRAAWLEYKVTKHVGGLATEEMLAAEHPPDAFIDIELGFGLGEGPSLLTTLQDAALARRRSDHVGTQKLLPAKRRITAGDRQARLQAMLQAQREAA